MNVIGYNSDGNVKRYHFDKDKKPVLIKEPGESLGELENIPAIKRQVKKGQEDE